MKIWILEHKELNFVHFVPVPKWNIDYALTFKGKSQLENWKNYQLVCRDKRCIRLNDYPGFYAIGLKLFNDKAIHILWECLKTMLKFCHLNARTAPFQV